LLIEILFSDHVFLSQLLIVRALDVALNCSAGMDIFIGRESAWSPDKISIYAKLICKMNGKMSMRLKCALSALIAKVIRK